MSSEPFAYNTIIRWNSMKKLISLFLCLFLSLSLVGCGSKPSSIEVADGVNFSLVDVLEVSNAQVNTIYFYFLASVENTSDKTYHTSNLNYQLCVPDHGEYTPINPIDQYKTIITNDVRKGMTTYVYGYIGVPNTADKNIGLYVKAKDSFIPFDSVKIRTIKDDGIAHSEEKKFTVYSDQYYEFEVDATNVAYKYKDGNSTIEGLKIIYRNKTNSRLVIPFLSPICDIDGFKVSSLSNADKLKAMSQEEIEKQDFSQKGLEAKTQQIRAETLGYQVFYLAPEQELKADILFEAKDAIPDFSAKQKNGVTITINSPALGYRQLIKVKYTS